MKRLILGLVLSLFCAGLSPLVANAEPAAFKIAADDTVAHEGGGAYSWPGQNRATDALPSEPAPYVVIRGVRQDDGTLEIEAEDFAVEPSWVIVSGSVFEGPFPRIDWRAVGPVEGTYAEETGETSISLNLIQTVSIHGVPPCEVGPVPVTLSTEYDGELRQGHRFTAGLDGPGALAGGWADVPAPSGESCDLRALGCLVRQHLLAGPGSFGLARKYEISGTVPWQQDKTVDKFGIVGYEDEGGCLGKRPDPGPGPDPDPDPGPGDPAPDPEFSVSLLLHKAGPKKVNFYANVSNSGGATTGVKVCAKAMKGPKLQTPRCQNVGSVAAGASFVRKLTVVLSPNRVERRRQLKRGKLKVTVAADGQAAKSVTRRVVGAGSKR